VPLRHHDLIAWQRADDLCVSLHLLTKRKFPHEERYDFPLRCGVRRTQLLQTLSKALREDLVESAFTSCKYLGVRLPRLVTVFIWLDDFSMLRRAVTSGTNWRFGE
jgi:hypothetical protein